MDSMGLADLKEIRFFHNGKWWGKTPWDGGPLKNYGPYTPIHWLAGCLNHQL